MIVINPDRTDRLINALTVLWKASARATHHFLAEGDVERLIPLVMIRLSDIENLIVASDDDRPIAFMGISNTRHYAIWSTVR